MMHLLAIVKWAAAGMAATLATIAALVELDRAFPPPLDTGQDVSVEVLDRNGDLLRAYATPQGRWRLAVDLNAVDPQFIGMLVAYEDRRFPSHPGVDPWAIGRAAWQLAVNGRIVSGGSTLTMQLARLIEPRESRSVTAKLRQIIRAIQIERRLTKDEILARYLTLAPYGGNLEGVRAASLAWFGKEPVKLRLAEAALLVALPQSPESRRPDRHPRAARLARDRVLRRMVDANVIVASEIERASAGDVPHVRRPLPVLAAHLAERAVAAAPDQRVHRLTIDRTVQASLEQVAREAAERLGSRLTVAMVMADATTGDVLGHVGSADYGDDQRAGWIDMSTIERSPGSTLKPFIYGLAFEEGVVAAETLIADRPADFSGYRPRNFDMGYRGDVSVREALQLSLNVPAVKLLEAVGPMRLAARFRRAGVSLKLPTGEAPGLAIGLGGAGITLEDLVTLYTGLAGGGRAVELHSLFDKTYRPVKADLLSPQAGWQVSDILSGIMAPLSAAPAAIAYKTGTSYGYRDAWSVGYDGAHVLGVWVGRADNASVPGLTGITAAAPILFEGFSKAGLDLKPLPARPRGTQSLARADLPASLRRFSGDARSVSPAAPAEPPPAIVFPPAGSRVVLADGAALQPLVIKLQGGRAPFRWLANGRPLPDISRRRIRQWQPDGRGAATLTVIDAAGRAASVDLFVE